MADKQLSRAEIEADTQHIRAEIQERIEQSQESAWIIEERGLTIGEPGNRLTLSPDVEAPKMHPVWAPELAHEARMLERTGAATFEYEGIYRQLAEWAAAGKPHIDIIGEQTLAAQRDLFDQQQDLPLRDLDQSLQAENRRTWEQLVVRPTLAQRVSTEAAKLREAWGLKDMRKEQERGQGYGR